MEIIMVRKLAIKRLLLEKAITIRENRTPRPVILMAPKIIPAAAHAATTDREPITPDCKALQKSISLGLFLKSIWEIITAKIIDQKAAKVTDLPLTIKNTNNTKGKIKCQP
jgi:hypothetical protein